MRWRFLLLYFLLFLVFAVLGFRLVNLTVINGRFYREMADNQRLRLHRLVAPRGIIFDRQARPLVRNIPIFKKCEGSAEHAKCTTMSRDEALKLEAQNHDAEVTVEVGREYLYPEATAHLLGYLGEATEDEVASGQNQIGQLIGRTGVEEEYEGWLRGRDGVELLEVDNLGTTLRKIGKKEPVGGNNLFLSVDLDLQLAAYQALGGKKGAVVATDPGTGQVLALVSSPSFDPNLLVRNDEQDSEKIRGLMQDANQPLFDRALGGAYPPGSTFKIVSSTAGLEDGKITAATQINDPGKIVIGAYSFANWYFTRYGATEGQINVVRALARSTDTYFYQLGEMVGAPSLVNWASRFGLGELTGIDLPGETKGFLPEPELGNWFLGNTYHLAIGQGHLGLSPLQVNRMTAVIANGGRKCHYRVKMNEEGQDERNNCQDLGLKAETMATIKEGLVGACSPGGTAGIFFNFSPQVACKTGTAEFDDPAGRTHAWFTAFAPLDNPKIVVTAIVEAGGEGSVVAAPIAKKVLEAYFHNQKTN